MTLEDYKNKLNKPLRPATLCFLIREDEVLLALKKRGFGRNRWNGVGGKPNPGESIKETAARETYEEIGVTVEDLEMRAILDFYFPQNPEWEQTVTVYFSNKWEGVPVETEEMKPSWYKKTEIPLDSMWPDDKDWLPQVLKGDFIKGEFLFGKNDVVLDYRVTKVSNFVR